VRLLDADLEIYTKSSEEEDDRVVMVDSGLDWVAFTIESTPTTVSRRCRFLDNTPLVINQELLIYWFHCSRVQDALDE